MWKWYYCCILLILFVVCLLFIYLLFYIIINSSFFFGVFYVLKCVFENVYIYTYVCGTNNKQIDLYKYSSIKKTILTLEKVAILYSFSFLFVLFVHRQIHQLYEWYHQSIDWKLYSRQKLSLQLSIHHCKDMMMKSNFREITLTNNSLLG